MFSTGRMTPFGEIMNQILIEYYHYLNDTIFFLDCGFMKYKIDTRKDTNLITF